MERFEDENPKNLYVIRRKLSTYKMLPDERHWDFRIGHFQLLVSLTTDDNWKISNYGNDFTKFPDLRIINYEKFNVNLYEDTNADPSVRIFIYLNRDPRFKNYDQIHYDVIHTPTGGKINQSDGNNMPLLQLMELIRLLHRLSNLTAFL